MFCNSDIPVREINVIGQPQFFIIWFKHMGVEPLEDINEIEFLLELELVWE
jgi:hypothetical protein